MFKICLLGSIPKGDDVRKTWKDWKEEYKEKLSLIPDVKFVDGDAWTDETKPLELVGHDLNLVKTADLIIVNAESKLGAGTSQEMVVAKHFGKSVVSILPKDTHHRRSNIVFNGTNIEDWIHPFILTFSDYIADNIEDCVEWTEQYKNDPSKRRTKNISIVDEAIEAYKKEQAKE